MIDGALMTVIGSHMAQRVLVTGSLAAFYLMSLVAWASLFDGVKEGLALYDCPM